VAKRVMRALHDHLPVGHLDHLRVRVVRFAPRTADGRQAPAALASGH
jgi:hypothetical protein